MKPHSVIAVEILQKLKGDHKDEGSDSGEYSGDAEEEIAKDFFKAVKDEDVEGFWSAITAAFMKCESEPHDESDVESEPVDDNMKEKE